VRTSIEDGPRRYPLTRLLWLSAGRGASAQALAATAQHSTLAALWQATDSVYGEAAPFVAATVGRGPADQVRIALAPPACTIESSPATDRGTWRPEPTGSYAIRTVDQDLAEYWRVSCAGVVRAELPAPRRAVTAADVRAAQADVSEPHQLEWALANLYREFGFRLVDRARVLWSGPVPLPGYPRLNEQTDEVEFTTVYPNVTVLAAPAADGGWLGMVTTLLEVGPNEFTSPATPTFQTTTDLGDPQALLGIRIHGWDRMALVLAPTGTSTVRIMNRDGAIVGEAPAAGRATLLQLSQYAPPDGLTAQALDASGALLAAAEFARINIDPGHFSDWD
jgi:hypothetical protein